jgi:transposase
MSPYREKVIIRIVGQSLFGAEVHHFEQVRCRMCGNLITAPGSAEVLEGIGSSYITYHWSACAMLLVMHYFAGAPFKRLEMLHNGWGVPMPDANQWKIADECTELLDPLLTALEQYGIRNAVNLRIDDTGSEVIELRKQIRAEIAALEKVGESTNDVRTAINATGVYLETADGAIISLFYTGRHHAGEIIDQLLRLTLFYQEPNVPLDTNLVEQTLIIPVRYLAGSFYFKTINGSDVGDLSMTLV